MNHKRLILLSGQKKYGAKLLGLYGSSLIAYWPMNEMSGTVALDASGNARNGAYTGVDLANAAAPAKTHTMAPYFDAINDYLDVYSASLAGAFNASEGSAVIWCKPSAAAFWTDGAYHLALTLSADANNMVAIFKSDTNSTLYWRYAAGGIFIFGTTAGYSTTDWFQIGITWSVANDRMRRYYNGAQVEGDVSSLGTWAGALGANLSLIGAYDKGHSSDWKGCLSHCYILNREATAAEILQSYNWAV